MSEDSGKAAPAPQEIDLDNIEVEVLIICKNPNQLNQAGSFLTRRGWPTTVISDLTKAIEHLADKKPDFVLISFSHPSPRIAKLPDLISQTFNLTCLGFTESGDAQSGAKLNNSKLRHKINGQASGPSIHRSIRKILAERFNIKTEDRSAGEREARERDSGSNIVKVKGGGGTAANGPGVIMQKSSANATRDKGAQMVKGQGTAPSDSQTQSGGDMTALSGTSGVAGGPENGFGSGSEPNSEANLGDQDSDTEGDSANPTSSLKSRGPRKSLKDLSGGEPSNTPGNMLAGKSLDVGALKKSLLGEDGSEVEPVTESPNESVPQMSASTGGEGPSSLGPSFEGRANKNKGQAGQSLEEVAAAHKAAQEAADGTRSTSSSGDKVPLMEYDTLPPAQQGKSTTLESADARAAGRLQSIDEEKKRQEKLTKEKEAAERAAKDPAFAAQSLMQKAVEAAMARYCKTPQGTPPLPLEEITYVGVFPIESEAMPGYLVVVWQAPDLSAREAFLRDCEVEIRTAFNSMNVAGKVTTGFWTQLPAVEFVAWADNKAGFHFMTAHQKREVGVAFFRSAGPLPQPKAAPGGMYALNVIDMSSAVAVNFKAYIYLKENNKHFMYLRNGRKIQPEQKKRLLANQVNEVLMKAVDLENLRQYLAAGYLSGLIIEFNLSITSASQPNRKSS